MKPSEQWGPANPIHRIGKYARSSDSEKNETSAAVSSVFTAVDQISANTHIDADALSRKILYRSFYFCVFVYSVGYFRRPYILRQFQ